MKKVKIPSPDALFESKKIPDPKAESTEWSFSFKYFRQIGNFGLSTIDAGWATSLIQRLNDLNNIDIDSLTKSKKFKRDIRYHIIDWTAKNIPIARSDFNWIDKDIINNEEEFPFIQFHISRALGRIVGFWNEKNTIFYIVLLDPMHNIQPSKYNAYKIDGSDPLSCHISSLLFDIDRLKNKVRNNANVDIMSELNRIPSRCNISNAVLLYLEDEYLKRLEELLEKQTASEIIELGILACD